MLLFFCWPFSAGGLPLFLCSHFDIHSSLSSINLSPIVDFIFWSISFSSSFSHVLYTAYTPQLFYPPQTYLLIYYLLRAVHPILILLFLISFFPIFASYHYSSLHLFPTSLSTSDSACLEKRIYFNLRIRLRIVMHLWEI